MSFERAVGHVLLWEGENSWDAAGGETRFGISQAAFPDVDIEHLTRDDAKALYRSRYWAPLRGDELPESVGFALFDAAVNVGVYQAVKFLQRAMGIHADGILGPATFAAVKAADPVRLVREITLERAKFYQALSTYPVYGTGWLRRTIDTAMRAA